MTALLEIQNLAIDFVERGKTNNTPVRGLDITMQEGEILGVVGESGCGKTLTGLAILDALPNGAVRHGDISVNGVAPAASNGSESRVSIVFQNPGTAFNPVFTLGAQLTMVAARYHKMSKGDIRRHVVKYLELAGLPDPKQVLRSYPHQLSGGMQQRTMIAMALLCEPQLLILDEPTTALDVTIAKQILETVLKLRDNLGFGVLLISHNLGVVRDICDRVVVLYAGRIIESGTTAQVLGRPRHPYTRALIQAIPQRDSRARLTSIPGSVPSNLLLVQGCAFAPRCGRAIEACTAIDPGLLPIQGDLDGHLDACMRSQER
jgi:peptide/nickel transport system ATP-binding protein